MCRNTVDHHPLGARQLLLTSLARRPSGGIQLHVLDNAKTHPSEVLVRRIDGFRRPRTDRNVLVGRIGGRNDGHGPFTVTQAGQMQHLTRMRPFRKFSSAAGTDSGKHPALFVLPGGRHFRIESGMQVVPFCDEGLEGGGASGTWDTFRNWEIGVIFLVLIRFVVLKIFTYNSRTLVVRGHPS